MGRSRGNFHAEDDPSQRSRRKKNVSGGKNSESSSTGQGTTDGKRALYHCNNCNKDITGRIRMKCAVCSDFDLCVECFSVGAEVDPHKSSHSYRVMDTLSFPLITHEWNADEEMLLLEGLDMYGMDNWAEVAEHVATKTKEVCVEHYRNAYLNSPYFPLPDMTRLDGKNRNELLAMGKVNLENKIGKMQLKEDNPFSPSRVRVEDSCKGGPSGRSPSASSAGAEVNETASNMSHAKDQGDHPKTEGRSVGRNKPKSANAKAPYLAEAIGYNPKRHEFDIEYDNDAEQLLVDMEFKENDTDVERDLKMEVLRIYLRRLDERQKRKDFIIERNLLDPNPFGALNEEETKICKKYDRFMRLHSKEEHEQLMKTVLEEYRIKKRIVELQVAKALGIRKTAEADRYFEQRRKEAEERKQSSQADSFATRSTATSAGHASSSAGHASSSADRDPAANLLSESELQLCREIGLVPQQYLKLQELMTKLILSGKVRTVSDVCVFIDFDPLKIKKVYDMLVKKGIVPPGC